MIDLFLFGAETKEEITKFKLVQLTKSLNKKFLDKGFKARLVRKNTKFGVADLMIEYNSDLHTLVEFCDELYDIKNYANYWVQNLSNGNDIKNIKGSDYL